MSVKIYLIHFILLFHIIYIPSLSLSLYLHLHPPLMASVNPQFYSDCTFPSHLSEFSTVPTVGGVFGGPMWSQESLVPLFDNALLDHVVVSPQSDMTSSYPGGKLETSSDFAVPSLSSADYYKADLCGMTPAGVDHLGAAIQPNMCHFREEYCCGFLDDFKPLIPAAGDNSWVYIYI
jgi:hypothetical protein